MALQMENFTTGSGFECFLLNAVHREGLRSARIKPRLDQAAGAGA